MTSLRRGKIEEIWMARVAFGRPRKRSNREQRLIRRVNSECRTVLGSPRRAGWNHRQQFLHQVILNNRFRDLLLRVLREKEQPSDLNTAIAVETGRYSALGEGPRNV